MSQQLQRKSDEQHGSQHGKEHGIGLENDIYLSRFSPTQTALRSATWEILVKQFFQKYVPKDGTVVDIGAGDGFFLKNILAKRKVAVDLSPHVLDLKNFGCEVLQVPATEIRSAFNGQADVVFMSNFLEHLPNKRMLLEVLHECHEILRLGGRVMILQPNIRYVGPAYWDYIDHHIALTEHSLVEALEVSGFRINQLIPRFLPYTAKSSLGSVASGKETLISWYLRLPILWKFFGQQTFVIGEKVG